MGLFSKKDPCAICGGKVSGLFPWKIEGQYVCSDCHGVIDLPDDRGDNLTMAEFRAYRDFRAENEKLRDQFVIGQKIDFGLWDTKMLFDFDHRLFCMSKRLDRTIFPGAAVTGFSVWEDSAPLYFGDAGGLVRYESAAPQRAMDMAPQIDRFLMQRQMQLAMEHAADRLRDRREDDRPRPPRPRFDVPEPFHSFNVELRLDHPYWPVIRCDMGGPTFDNDLPDVNDYLRQYDDDIRAMEELVQALMAVAFPGAPQYAPGEEAVPAGRQTPPAAQPADAVDQIRRYRALLEEGIITAEEFDAKKKQLMDL